MLILSDFHVYALVLISVVTLISILLSLKRKANFPHMTGMIMSMFLGMNVGLTAGVLFGAVYQGDLFFSTIVGMAIGILAGALCGICFGLLSLLEGVMAGLMGGMMGAMLGEMIAVEQAIVFIKIFLVLSVCTIFLLIILSTPNLALIHNKSWFLKPILTFLLVGGVIVLGNSLNKEIEPSIPHNHKEDTHATSEKQIEIQTIVIETAGMKYSPQDIIVEKNSTFTLQLKNSDQIDHDIEIKTSAFTMMRESNHHKIDHNVIHLHAQPETTSELTLSMNEVGTYTFYCTLPGHRENGMVGQLVVK
ncbi:plastocyanin/azurin family copper-binding protein [Paenisporosarcina antarctica]|uniref:plastocyanin/azurin family copper-binding protein n=1 Tax=Paenisporosarcina antarctica TaxID=417367 RepID=UPI001FB8E221|nr:plastocyanin/azurin family copper-binding protein [Paenisporosarcina antarctica]